MAMQKQRSTSGEGTTEAAETSTTDPAVLAAAGSVLLSQYQYFMRGNKELGIFIGLWPPTFLAFASYFNQKRMSQRLKSLGPSRIMDSIEQMISNR